MSLWLNQVAGYEGSVWRGAGAQKAAEELTFVAK
jgi:hypothetical protein